MPHHSEKIEEYKAVLEKHGFINSGDNLVGFQMDLDAYLDNEDEMFSEVSVKKGGESGLQLEAKCISNGKFDLETMKVKVINTWEKNIRYLDFDRYHIENQKNGFDFLFVTTAPKLGVSGIIKVRQVEN